jgi:hypothetical protein
MTARIAYLLYIATFVVRGRETIIHPKERANLHLLVGFAQLLYVVGIHAYNLTRAEEILGMETEIEEG